MSKPASLSTTLGPLSLINPFILASGPPTADGDMIRRAFQTGWGGAVIKTIHPDGMEIRDLSPRFGAWKGARGDLAGFENIELLSKRTISYWEHEIRQIKQEYPDHILIASIMGETDPDTWTALASRVEKAGCDAIELNVSCPHGMPEAGVGSAIGQNPEMVKELTGIVVRSVKIPVFVKLTPNITDIGLAASAAAAGGAEGISAINTVQCIIGVNLETLDPLPSVNGYATQGGYSGPAIKPIGLQMVAKIAQTVTLPVMGIGGVTRWEDAAEYLLLGASAVQVCTAVMWHGYGIITAMNAGLSSYLASKGVASPDALRGASLAKITTHQALNRDTRIIPHLSEPEVCSRCGRCIGACRDGGYQALQMSDRRLIIDETRCDGCGLCILVCMTGALTARADPKGQSRVQ
jgi:dihydropyrimidine dehydrogenase (NAD+) subunit PreA